MKLRQRTSMQHLESKLTVEPIKLRRRSQPGAELIKHKMKNSEDNVRQREPHKLDVNSHENLRAKMKLPPSKNKEVSCCLINI